MADIDKYTVRVGDDTVRLNEHLAKQQNISDEALELLKESHVERIHLFAAAKVAAANDDVALLRELAAKFEALEFRQQALWNFPQDANYHMWFTLPGCTCPTLDNYDRRGTAYRVYNGNCLIHGTHK